MYMKVYTLIMHITCVPPGMMNATITPYNRYCGMAQYTETCDDSNMMEADRNTDGILFTTVVVLLFPRSLWLTERTASVVTAAKQARNPNTTPMVILLRMLSLSMKLGYTMRSRMRIVSTAVRSEQVLVIHVKGTDK